MPSFRPFSTKPWKRKKSDRSLSRCGGAASEERRSHSLYEGGTDEAAAASSHWPYSTKIESPLRDSVAPAKVQPPTAVRELLNVYFCSHYQSSEEN